jgi:regulator of protease activity HflC (stomatin/prohibitin superfamily)
MSVLIGIFFGFIAWFIVRHGIFGFFSVNQNERAVKTVFGRAQRLPGGGSVTDDDPDLSEQEKERYRYPALKVLPPGGPYFKLPWEKVHKVTIATQTINMA